MHEALRHENQGYLPHPARWRRRRGRGRLPQPAGQATIALAGPLTGAVLAAGTGLVYFATRNGAFAAAAAWMALINLFNLLPVVPLDGGRVVKSITCSIGSRTGLAAVIAGMLLGAVLAFTADLWIFVILIPLGLLDYLYDRYQHEPGRAARRGGRREACAYGDQGRASPQPSRRSARAHPRLFRLLCSTGDTAVAVHAGDGPRAGGCGGDARPAGLNLIVRAALRRSVMRPQMGSVLRCSRQDRRPGSSRSATPGTRPGEPGARPVPRRNPPGRGRAQLRRWRRDAAAAAPPRGGCAHGRFRNVK